MVEISEIAIARTLILMTSFLSCYVTTHSYVLESFLPSLINVRPEVQIRRFSSLREPKPNILGLTNLTNTKNQHTCGECKDGFLVVVMIHTYVANFENRKVIRDTWGRSSNCIKVLFFIGTTYDNNIMKRVVNENIEHFDIVRSNIEDSYKNLPYKHIVSLKWIKLFCPQVKYIVKTDSDIIVRLGKLYKLLRKSTWGTKRLIAGYIKYNEPVIREDSGVVSNKVVSKTEYRGNIYPPYCWGQFVLYSADAAFAIIDESSRVPYFKIEDIYVTGILAEHISGIKHVDLVPYWYITRDTLTNYTKEIAETDYVYGPYSLSLDEIRKYWDIISKHEKPFDPPEPKPKVIVIQPSDKPKEDFEPISSQTLKENSSITVTTLKSTEVYVPSSMQSLTSSTSKELNKPSTENPITFSQAPTSPKPKPSVRRLYGFYGRQTPIIVSYSVSHSNSSGKSNNFRKSSNTSNQHNGKSSSVKSSFPKTNKQHRPLFRKYTRPQTTGALFSSMFI